MGNGVQMDQIKVNSLKWSFIKYMIPCIIILIAGLLLIGHGTNYVQDWYWNSYETEIHYATARLTFDKTSVYWIISNAQVVLMPLWTVLCLAAVSLLFYNKELKKPISRLIDAAEKIAGSQLDFQIRYEKQNELGTLCKAFNDMRQALYENNKEMWQSLEERKRLNAAFSHDMRTPLTVLKGYVELLQQYTPDGRISEEKLLNVLSMMDRQVTRLEHYTQEMNHIQKIEDITPTIKPVSTDALLKDLTNTGNVLCMHRQFRIQLSSDSSTLQIDDALVIQVYENMLANAARYAKSRVDVICRVCENKLTITVSDDGCGFTHTALKNAANPFFRDEKDCETHFGLGLYICRILCEKCGGGIHISNHENGAAVTSEFFCGNISKNR